MLTRTSSRVNRSDVVLQLFFLIETLRENIPESIFKSFNQVIVNSAMGFGCLLLAIFQDYWKYKTGGKTAQEIEQKSKESIHKIPP